LSAVTLDLWHTLVYVAPEDEERYMAAQVRIAREALAQAPLLPGARALALDELGRLFEEEYAAAVKAASEGRTVTSPEQFLRAAAQARCTPDLDRYMSELRHEVEALPFRRAPGALQLLRELRSHGYRVAVISNTIGEPGAYLRPALTAMGFDPLVESYVFSDELAWSKPAPEIFRAALAAIDSVPSDAVHIGDGWSDIEGARRAGYRAGVLFTGLQEYGERYRALFASTYGEVLHPDHRVAKLDEILPLVRELLPLGTQR
jgi:FMN phosphatase YigB (HAD superfamily)